MSKPFSTCLPDLRSIDTLEAFADLLSFSRHWHSCQKVRHGTANSAAPPLAREDRLTVQAERGSDTGSHRQPFGVFQGHFFVAGLYVAGSARLSFCLFRTTDNCLLPNKITHLAGRMGEGRDPQG